jgi:hypothetical protein
MNSYLSQKMRKAMFHHWMHSETDQKSAFENNVSPSKTKTKNSWKLTFANSEIV